MLQDLPEFAYQILVEEHLSELEVKTVRLVSKECKSATDTILTALKPKDIANCKVFPIVVFPSPIAGGNFASLGSGILESLARNIHIR